MSAGALVAMLAAVKHGKELLRHAQENVPKGCRCDTCSFHRQQAERHGTMLAAKKRAEDRKAMIEARKARRK